MLRPFCENKGDAKRESIRRPADATDGGVADGAGGAWARDGDDELMVWLSRKAGASSLLAKRYGPGAFRQD
jgi:hypothetical protein